MYIAQLIINVLVIIFKKYVAMKKSMSFQSLILLVVLLFQSPGLLGQPDLSKEELTLLKIISGINYTFKIYANEIWPGYDLSKEPYITYLPDKWALYLNATDSVEGFETYPSDWPTLGTTAMIYKGTYKDLIGQFVFDFQIDSITSFAMGLPTNLVFSFDNPSYMLFSTTIHEGFHQYQRNHFGEIPWAREEQYPILDLENTSLAALEMLILKDALIEHYKKNDVKDLLTQFVAVRYFRWRNSNSFIKKYEQGQEINEGTARYVEMKAVDCFLKLNNKQINKSLVTDLRKDFADISMPDLLIKDIETRMTGISVAPDDMLRNRIYPVGASLGFIMDGLKIDWKGKFQAAGTDVSFPQIIIEHFDLDTNCLKNYLDIAKIHYQYQEIYLQSGDLIRDYFSSYQEAKTEFERQEGINVKISLPSNGIMRFRSTKEKKWLVDNGRTILCLKYDLYSLKSVINKDLILELHNKALLDRSDWENKRKNVVFYVKNISELIINNTTIALTKDIDMDFDGIKLLGEEFKLEVINGGRIKFHDNIIEIDFR